MDNEACACSQLDSVSLTTITECQRRVQRRCEEVFKIGNFDSTAKSVFSYKGRVGFAIGCGSGSGEDQWMKAGVSLPVSFGFFVSTIDIEDINRDLGESRIAIQMRTTLKLYPWQGDDMVLWDGHLTLSGRLNNPSTFTVIPHPSEGLEFPDVIKNYDWRCLIKCSPACIVCKDSIECWALCAAGCIIACALPF